MNTIISLLIPISLSLLISLLSFHSSAESDNTDKMATQQVIIQQLTAFAEDKNEEAYSFVSPKIKSRIVNAKQFMRMVKSTYTALYNASHYRFSRYAKIQDQIIQEVIVEDARGDMWRAFYALNKTANQEWKIFSVEIQALNMQRI